MSLLISGGLDLSFWRDVSQFRALCLIQFHSIQPIRGCHASNADPFETRWRHLSVSIQKYLQWNKKKGDNCNPTKSLYWSGLNVVINNKIKNTLTYNPRGSKSLYYSVSDWLLQWLGDDKWATNENVEWWMALMTMKFGGKNSVIDKWLNMIITLTFSISLSFKNNTGVKKFNTTDISACEICYIISMQHLISDGFHRREGRSPRLVQPPIIPPHEGADLWHPAGWCWGPNGSLLVRRPQDLRCLNSCLTREYWAKKLQLNLLQKQWQRF